MGNSADNKMARPVFGGWKLVKNENFDEYMAKIGVGWVMRKAGAAATSTTTIAAEGSDVRITISSTVKSADNVYKIGVAQPETTMDGRSVQSTVSWDGEVLLKSEAWDGKVANIKYVVEGSNMTQILETGGVTCKRTHQKV